MKISAALYLAALLKTTGSSLKSTIQASMNSLSRATQISAEHLPCLSLCLNLQSLQHDGLRTKIAIVIPDVLSVPWAAFTNS